MATVQKSLLARNAAGDALSAGERALLRFGKTIAYIAGGNIAAQLPNIANAVASGQFHTSYALAGFVVAQIFVVAGLTWDKYTSAKGETWKPAQIVGDQLITLAATSLGVRSDVGVFAAADSSTAPAAVPVVPVTSGSAAQ